MPNSNGRIYIDPTPDPDIGVGLISDVKKVLEENSNNVSTLCASKKVNRWARYKPERYAGTTPEEKRHGHTRPISYSIRKANNFGLDVPYCNENGVNVMNARVYNFVYFYNDEEQGWEDVWKYLQPRGNVNADLKEFYRIQDFSRIPSDDTDPHHNDESVAPHRVYGYNHNAKLPFNVSMDESGCTFYYDSAKDVWIYEVNKAVTSKLVFTFYNSIGDELHLQDFVTIPSDSSSINDNTVAWRPIIQVFNDYKGAYDDYWYDRSSAQYEIAGDAITSDQNSFWQVAVDLEDSNFQLSQYYHVCIGVGLCNKAVSSWGDGTKTLFLPPYLPEKADLFEFPFYCIIRVMSHNARTLWVDGLQFHVNSPMPAWVTAPGSDGYFTIHTLMEGSTIGLTLKVTKLRSQSLVFVKGSDTTTPNPLKIKYEETISERQGVTEGYMTPSVGPNTSGQQSPWAEDNDGITIPYAQSEQDEDRDHAFTMYAIMDISNIPVNGYGWYHLHGEQGSTTYDFGSFSIHKVQYTR